MRQRTIIIQQRDGSTRQAKGYVYPCGLAGIPHNKYWWSVTHIASGKTLPFVAINNKADMDKLIEKLAPICGWTAADISNDIAPQVMSVFEQYNASWGR